MAAIYFDMDGTIADFYGVEGWLDYIQNEDVTPYEVAKPLCKEMTMLKYALNKLKSAGYTIGVISWTAMNGSKEYNKAVRRAKIEWLKKYFGDLFTEIHVVKYGTNKYSVAKEKNGILFDDDETVRAKWRGIAHDVKDIVKRLFWLIANGTTNIPATVTKTVKKVSKKIRRAVTINNTDDIKGKEDFHSRIPHNTDYCAYVIECFEGDKLKFLKVGKASDFDGRMREHLRNKQYNIDGIRINLVQRTATSKAALELEKKFRNFYKKFFELTRNDRFYGASFQTSDLEALASL